MTQDILDKIRMGYFLIYKNTGGFFGDGIVLKQKMSGFNPEDAQYTHVECSGGEITAVNISPPISKLVDITQEHKGEHVKVMRFKNADYEAGKRYKVAYFSATLCNKGYNIPGILAFIFKWIKSDNRLVFCSEGGAWALTKVFPGVFGNLTPDKIMPAHFLNPDLFELVWEGDIT